MGGGAVVAIMAANAAARRQAQEQHALDTLRVAGATAPERACRPEEMGLAPDDAGVRMLIDAGVVRERSRDGVWLDEAALVARRVATRTAARSGTRRVLLVVVLLALVITGVSAMIVLDRMHR